VSEDRFRSLCRSNSRRRQHSPASSGTDCQSFAAGAAVEARYRGRDKWYPGVVARVRSDGSCNIDYDDGEKELSVAPELIRAVGGSRGGRSPKKSSSGSLREGSKVKGNYRGRGKFYAGVISRDRGDGTYDIDYDDGEKETRVKADLIESVGGGGRSPARTPRRNFSALD